jgi:hypothetical protein
LKRSNWSFSRNQQANGEFVKVKRVNWNIPQGNWELVKAMTSEWIVSMHENWGLVKACSHKQAIGVCHGMNKQEKFVKA